MATENETSEAMKQQVKARNEETAKLQEPSCDVNDMTLEDYNKYCLPEDRPAENFDELCDKSYDEFIQGEGKRNKIYLDYLGHPTIGIGHLIFNKNDLNNPKKMAAWKQSFISLPLVNQNGRALSTAEKANQFQTLENGVRNGRLITKPIPGGGKEVAGFGMLNEQGIKQVFKQDFRYHYNKTKEVVPELDQMLLGVQFSTIHGCFAIGNANWLKKANVNDPASIMKEVTRIRDRKGTSAGERNTIKETNDTIQTTKFLYRMNKELEQDLLVRDEKEIIPEKDEQKTAEFIENVDTSDFVWTEHTEPVKTSEKTQTAQAEINPLLMKHYNERGF